MARGSPAVPVDRSLFDGRGVYPILSGRGSARARNPDKAWVGTRAIDREPLPCVSAAGAVWSPVLRLRGGAGNRASPQGFAKKQRCWKIDDGRSTIDDG